MKGTTGRRPLQGSVALLLTAVLIFVFVLPAAAAKPAGSLTTFNTPLACEGIQAQARLDDSTWFEHKNGWLLFTLTQGSSIIDQQAMFIEKGTVDPQLEWIYTNFVSLAPGDYQVAGELFYGKGKGGQDLGKSIAFDWANNPATVVACPG